MIVSFADVTTADFYHASDSKAARKIAQALWPPIRRKLDLLNACATPEDLRVPPANRLEKLRGDWMGYYSIRVNEQYRIVFRFVNGDCERCTLRRLSLGGQSRCCRSSACPSIRESC